MDNRAALLTGIDIPIPECQLVLHQPTIKEISMMGEEDFFKAVQAVSIDKTMILKDKNDLSAYNNFQIFITAINESEEKEELKSLVSQLFLILFPSGKVSFTPRSMIFTGKDGLKTIDESNFDNLQYYIKLIFCMNEKKDKEEIEYNIDENNKKAKEIRDKILKGRKKAAEMKSKMQGSIFANYLSALSIGLHISIIELSNYTMYQLFDSMERYSLWMNWDLDIRSRLAGAKADKELENWMKNIHNYC